MDLGISTRLQPILSQISEMVEIEIAPMDAEYFKEVEKGDRWSFTARQTEILELLKNKAKDKGLWNLWLTNSEKGFGLTTVEYAHLAEQMGKAHLAPEVFNCSAPDTGNMEVFERYGSPEMKTKWLEPLLGGKIRSAYLMTEPNVASSDATNISLDCRLEGDHYILNGEKWWATGAGDPRCAVYIIMVRTSNDGPKYGQHSMIVVDAKTSGIQKIRAMQVYGDDEAPHGHMHLKFTNVKVPVSGLLLGEGQGFEISQGRLGPGRIHHCMRAIGMAEKALKLMCERSLSRKAFGKTLSELGANFDYIANARMQIEQARLLCLKAAWMMDQGDARAAAPWISQVKVEAPRIALEITDQAIQMFGAQGVSQDTPLARQWAHLRTLRLADGPDVVHRRQVARAELRKYTNEKI